MLISGGLIFSKLKKLYSKQKHACKLIFGMNKHSQSYPLFLELKALNIYKLNVYQMLIFMFKQKYKLNPKVFESDFTEIKHKYQTRHSKNNFVKPRMFLKSTSFIMTYRGPKLWKDFQPQEFKNIPSIKVFKTSLKKFLLIEDPENILYHCF